MNLKDYFGKAYVLNLDCCPERWDKFQETAAEAGITGFERVRAVHGDSCPHPAFWRAGNGAWGCLMSHLRVLQDALMDNLDSFVVFEDDACFSKDFATRLPKVMKELSKHEWHQFYLGGQHLYKEACPPWPLDKRGLLLRCKNVNRTHAYAVNRRFMAQLQQHIMHMPDYIASHETWESTNEETKEVSTHEKFFHVDHQMGTIHERLQHLIVAADPWLCGQGANSSNINGQLQDEQWWPDKGWYQ